MPDVSIIIPTYNREKTIERAIDSVLSQNTDLTYEIIVVDDGSTDGTQKIIEDKYGDKVRYIRHETNKGGCAARNTGIRNAKGDYITFLDSDDKWFSVKLSRHYRFLKKTDSDIVICTVIRVDKTGESAYPEHHYTGDIHKQLLHGNFISTGMIFGKRECFKEGFDESLPRLQDWDLMLRLSKKYKVSHEDVPLAYYYIQSDSISANHQKLKEAAKIIYEKYRDEFDRDPEALSHIYTQIAVAEIMTNDPAAREDIKKAQKAHFTKKGMVIDLACTLHMQKLLKYLEEKRLSKRLH